MRLELIVEALPGADRDQLSAYLRSQGFDPVPMKVGVLLSDDIERLQKLLPTLSGTEQGEIAIPEALTHAVRSIRISKPRSLHSS